MPRASCIRNGKIGSWHSAWWTKYSANFSANIIKNFRCLHFVIYSLYIIMYKLKLNLSENSIKICNQTLKILVDVFNHFDASPHVSCIVMYGPVQDSPKSIKIYDIYNMMQSSCTGFIDTKSDRYLRTVISKLC